MLSVPVLTKRGIKLLLNTELIASYNLLAEFDVDLFFRFAVYFCDSVYVQSYNNSLEYRAFREVHGCGIRELRLEN